MADDNLFKRTVEGVVAKIPGNPAPAINKALTPAAPAAPAAPVNPATVARDEAIARGAAASKAAQPPPMNVAVPGYKQTPSGDLTKKPFGD